jgi:hypothetical protein
MGWLAGGPAKMAAMNKCLARNNKSRHVSRATNDASGTRNEPNSSPARLTNAWDAGRG